MNHDRDKASILDVLFMMLLIVFFTGIATASFLSGGLVPTLLLGALALFITWLLINDLRRGVRLPTRWEWFRAWMLVRPVLIGAVGFAFFMGIITYDRSAFTADNTTFGLLMTGIALVWALLILYTIWRAPHRREHDSEYKKRMGWKDLEEPL